jgi:hypothetical protein
MAVLTKTGYRSVDTSSTALQRNRAEDARLMQRINAAAAELHRLWSAGWMEDAGLRTRCREAVAALQAEIDQLYEQRRQTVAQRALLRETRAERWNGIRAPRLAA